MVFFYFSREIWKKGFAQTLNFKDLIFLKEKRSVGSEFQEEKVFLINSHIFRRGRKQIAQSTNTTQSGSRGLTFYSVYHEINEKGRQTALVTITVTIRVKTAYQVNLFYPIVKSIHLASHNKVSG